MVYVALEPDSDDTIVPEKIQQEIVTYVEETSFPAILAHIEIDCPKLSKNSKSIRVSKKFCKHHEQLESPFVKENWKYLLKLKPVIGMPTPSLIQSPGVDYIPPFRM
jgi:hypothetical protein